MARPSSKLVEYTLATEMTKVCPECKKEVKYPGPSMSCKCGWEGSRSDLSTKIISYNVKAYKTVNYT